VFLADPRVGYHGVVSARRALELAASCDAVFCYYAPTNANMINASPNKVYDAMAVGRPILINREVKVSAWVVENAVGSACAYEDVAGLRAAISRLTAERSSLPSFAARSRALFGQRSWGYQEPGLARIYLDLVAKRA
jgi:hypothetical protein